MLKAFQITILIFGKLPLTENPVFSGSLVQNPAQREPRPQIALQK